MSENSAIQINWKTKKDGMLINIRANDPVELDMLIATVTERLATLVDLENTTESMARSNAVTQNIATQLGGVVIEQTPAPAYAGTPTAPAPAYTPAVQKPQCTCGAGDMRFVPAGINKAGKPYRAFYACPRPQGQACNNKVNA